MRSARAALAADRVLDGRGGLVQCRTCGKEHDLLDLEPSFGRPDEIVALPGDARAQLVKETNDICRLAGDNDNCARYFVRCVPIVALTDLSRSFNWGLWAEVSQASFDRIWELWDDAGQASEPPMPGRLANRVPLVADTLGMNALGMSQGLLNLVE